MRPTIEEPLTPGELDALQQLWGTQAQSAGKVPHNDKLVWRGFAIPHGDRKVALTTLGSGKLVYETTRRHWAPRRRRSRRWTLGALALAAAILVIALAATPHNAAFQKEQ